MTQKQFQLIKGVTMALVVICILIAISIDNLLLALGGLLIGMIFLFLVRQKNTTVVIDERITIVAGKSARAAYVISTLFFTALSLFFVISGDQQNEIYIEALGVVMSLVVLLNIILYAISFYYFNHLYGGNKK